ncbi:MAG: DUF1667 domain-containing protein [Oscillospiraceae bacterium]|nr:DUF1667 domain-containing protein [Oscillospiraceae bacterium]
METRELTCIRCPMGCQLTVTIDGDSVSVTGNTCPRGEEYGKNEVVNPVRTVTSSVKVEGGELRLVSVKTKGDIPKGKIFEVMEAIRAARAEAPVHTGDVLIPNAACTGVDIVATKTVEKR